MVRGRLRSFVNKIAPSQMGLPVGSPMSFRVAVIVSASVLAAASAAPAFAEELGPEQARAFVVGKLFAYTCFDGTAGMGRIFSDGSAVGTIRPGGRGDLRFAALPAGTIRVNSNSVCAHLNGLPLEPCFRVEKIDYRSFRGSLAGFGFAYCDFYQRGNPRTHMFGHPATAAQPMNIVRAGPSGE
jgi:hypothetical protein